jgi:hypothetical protein
MGIVWHSLPSESRLLSPQSDDSWCVFDYIFDYRTAVILLHSILGVGYAIEV